MTDKQLYLLAGRVWMDLKGGPLHYIRGLSDNVERAVEEVLVEAFREVMKKKAPHATPERLVFTNGCFDLLHAGHVRHLEQSRALGTKLIVGLNSDASVRRIKVAGRPVQPQAERLLVLRSLRCVDDVHVFEADTPEELIQWLRPHVFTKGPECMGTEIPGAKFVQSYGGMVICTAREFDTSTTGTIDKVRAARTLEYPKENHGITAAEMKCPQCGGAGMFGSCCSGTGKNYHVYSGPAHISCHDCGHRWQISMTSHRVER